MGRFFRYKFLISSRSINKKKSFSTASFGGIFGLCLGGSLISFIEIFYFFSLKLYASYQGMIQTEIREADKQPNKVNVFSTSSLPDADDTIVMRLKLKNKLKGDAFHTTSTKQQSPSYDRYLD